MEQQDESQQVPTTGTGEPTTGMVFYKCPGCSKEELYGICPNCGGNDKFKLEDQGARCDCENLISWINCECGTRVTPKFFYQDPRKHLEQIKSEQESQNMGLWGWLGLAVPILAVLVWFFGWGPGRGPFEELGWLERTKHSQEINTGQTASKETDPSVQICIDIIKREQGIDRLVRLIHSTRSGGNIEQTRRVLCSNISKKHRSDSSWIRDVAIHYLKKKGIQWQ